MIFVSKHQFIKRKLKKYLALNFNIMMHQVRLTNTKFSKDIDTDEKNVFHNFEIRVRNDILQKV